MCVYPWFNGYLHRKWTWEVQNQDKAACIFHNTNTLVKGMNPIKELMILSYSAVMLSKFCSSYLDGIRDKGPYSYYFVACYFQNLFKIVFRILMQFPSSFFTKCFIKFQLVQLPNSTDWKNSCFLSSERSDFHTVINLSIAVHTSFMSMLTSLSVDEILLPRCWTGFLISKACHLIRK